MTSTNANQGKSTPHTIEAAHNPKVDESLVKYKDPLTYSDYGNVTDVSYSERLERRRSSKLERTQLLKEASLRSSRKSTRETPPELAKSDSKDSTKSIAQVTNELHWANKRYKAEVEEVQYQKRLVTKLVEHIAEMEAELAWSEAEISELRNELAKEQFSNLRKQLKESVPRRRSTSLPLTFSGKLQREPSITRNTFLSAALGAVLFLVVLESPQVTHLANGMGTLATNAGSALDGDLKLDGYMPDWLELLLRYW